MADNENDLKIVVRGLPFEATEQDVLDHFRLQPEQLNLPVWSDSGRCKGIAFITCLSDSEKTSLLSMDGQQFTAADNTRDLSIKEYEERTRKSGARRGGGSGRRGRGRGSAGRGRGDGAQSYISDDETSREVYVSNASFSSTKDSFMDFFADVGEVESITIPTQYQSGKPKGFAFVRFTTREARDAALKKNGMELDGRPLGIRENKGRAERDSSRQDNRRAPRERRTELSSKPSGCSTIFVGNLPWSTEEEELKSLFADCGEVVSSRIVRQTWTNKSRGFGYVEFAQEASVDTAVQKQITLHDRELRLDYAENLTN